VFVGIGQAAFAMAFWWLERSTVHALMVTLIAAIYMGFAVSDGRHKVIIVESAVAVSFALAASAAISVTPWLVAALYLAHGGKDLWQHRMHFVRGTRWWPPFCLAVDLTVAGIVAAQLGLGVQYQS